MEGHPDRLKELALSGDRHKLKEYLWYKCVDADFTFDGVTTLQHVCLNGKLALVGRPNHHDALRTIGC